MADTEMKKPGAWVDSDELAVRIAESLHLEPVKSATMEQDKSQPPTPDGTGRPANFAIIAPGLYRSSYPQHGHFDTLAELELKTIVTLVKEPLPLAYANFISSAGIIHHHVPIKANKDPEVYTEAKTVNKVLSLMLDPENYPMLIHCNKGKHRTGCMSACFRKATGWTLEASVEEYIKYSTPKDRQYDKAFIERYNADVMKPLALERRLYGRAHSDSATSIYTAYTAGSDLSIIGDLDTETQKRMIEDERLRASARYWSYK